MTDSSRLAHAAVSLSMRAATASLALRWQLAHLLLQALQAVQPAKSDAKWIISFLLR